MTAATAQPNAMQENPQLARRNRTILWLGVILVTLITLILIPAQVFADQSINDGSSGTAGSSGLGSLCANKTGAAGCLPSGRWGSFVGSIDGRIEPGPLGVISNLFNNIQQTTRTILPNMILMVTQVCWSSALALSDFAVNFAPLSEMMKQADKAIGSVVDNIMAGGIPGMLVFLAVLGWVGAAAFQIGTQRNAIKRGIATVLCLSAVVVMGGAAKADAGADSPSPGSPWWVVSAVDDTINKLTVGLDMDSINDDNPNFMAANVKGKDGRPTCQSYLYWMHQQYKDVSSGNMAEQRGEKTSAVTSSINRLWEETALRNWVTMQWGNPTQNISTTAEMANNAQVAYCHVLEAQSGTDVTTQAALTTKQLELSDPINGYTARYLFRTDGFIDPWNSKVNPNNDPLDRGQSVYRTRMGVFWETCTYNPSSSSPRQGWTELVGGLGSAKELKNSAQAVRPDSSDGRLWYVWMTNVGWKGQPQAACGMVLQNHLFQQKGDSTDPFIPTADQVRAAQSDNLTDATVSNSAYGQAATLGWTFDAPNLDSTYREANSGGNFDPANNQYAKGVVDTLNIFYNNANVDQLGALGTMIGSFVNMIVWGLLSLVLIISKIMLGVMGIFLIAAFLVQAFPFGDAPTKTLKNWIKTTCNMSMTGTLISFIGTLATFICGITLTGTSNFTSNNFLYSLVAGLSPLFAIAAISLFCTQIMKIGNPFSFKAMMKAAGGSALVSGISMLGMNKAKGMLTNGLHNLRPNRRAATRLTSKDSQGAGATESANILNKAATEQTALTNTGATAAGAAATGDGAPTLKERIQNGLDETFEGVRDKTADAFAKHHENLENAKAKHAKDATQDYEYYKKLGMSDTTAREKAEKLQALRDKRSMRAHKLGQVLRAGSTGAAFALAAAKSQPLRRAVKAGIQRGMPIAKTAAKVGLGALAMSNPITAPLGLAAFASAANPLNRNTRATFNNAVAATSKTAQLAGKGITASKNAITNSQTWTNAGRAVHKASAYMRGTDAARKWDDAIQGINDATYKTGSLAARGGKFAVSTGMKGVNYMASGQAMRDLSNAKDRAIQGAQNGIKSVGDSIAANGGLKGTVSKSMTSAMRSFQSSTDSASILLDQMMMGKRNKQETPQVAQETVVSQQGNGGNSTEVAGQLNNVVPEDTVSIDPNMKIEPNDSTSEAAVPDSAWAEAINSHDEAAGIQKGVETSYRDQKFDEYKSQYKEKFQQQGMNEKKAAKLAEEKAKVDAKNATAAYVASDQFAEDTRRATIGEQLKTDYSQKVYDEKYEEYFQQFALKDGVSGARAEQLASEKASKEADHIAEQYSQTSIFNSQVDKAMREEGKNRPSKPRS